jgi:hypothetical protein
MSHDVRTCLGIAGSGPLSLWERVRVRAFGRQNVGDSLHHPRCPHPLPLSQRERGGISKRTLRFAACGFALMACLAGCGRGGGLTSISGTVTYDGKPLEKGLISFVPADGKGPTAAAPVTDGKYSLKVAPGKKLVKIEGYQVTGQHPFSRYNPRVVVEQKQILPSRYNTNSELARDIAPTDRTCDFALEKSDASPR